MVHIMSPSLLHPKPSKCEECEAVVVKEERSFCEECGHAFEKPKTKWFARDRLVY